MNSVQTQLVTVGTEDAPTKIIYIKTNNTLAQVLTAGYLSANLLNLDLDQLSIYQMAVVYTTDTGCVILQVTFSAGIWSLATSADAGVIALPTVVNQMVYATTITGNIAASGVSRIFNAGGIDAGLSGTAGTFRSYPATAANGYLEVFGTANGGARNVTVTNAAHAQSTAYSIPDVGAATGQFNVVTGALVSGNLMTASGTAGKLADSGIAASAVQLKAAVKVAATADIGGGGAGPISVVVAGLTAASFVFPVIKSSSNAVAVAKCIATATGFDITFTADPGAACIVNYEAYVVGQ